jgi:hypothetical protein
MILAVEKLLEVVLGAVKLIGFSFEAGSFLGVLCYFESVVLIGLDHFLGGFVLRLRFGALLVTVVQKLKVFEVRFFGKSC